MAYEALLSGLIGTLIGAIASIATLVVQNYFHQKRETTRLIFDMAFKDYELRISQSPDRKPQAAPFPVILAYHLKMVDLIEHDRLTPQSAAEIIEAQAEMSAAVYGAAEKYQQ